MTEYHVKCGLAGIYAGTLKHNGEEWLQKSEVTKEALEAVALYMCMKGIMMRFAVDGHRYALRVVELKED